MGDSYVINQDTFERAIPILESRSFMEQKESKQILLSGLCQLEHFKSLMRDPLLEHHLYPYLDQFAQQVSYKYIPRGRIIYHDNENIGCLFFILRGSFTEFKLKSEDDLQKELYWDSQAEQFKSDLAGVTKTQRNLQDKRTQELMQLTQENDGQKGDELMNSISNNSIDPTKMSTQQKQMLFIRQKIQEQEVNERKGGKNGKANRAQTFQFKKQPTLEEVFFTEEYKKQSRKLKEAGDMALENEKFYSGSNDEQLLKMENKHQERYFRDHRCIYKKTRELQSGQSFGELYGNVDNTVICNKSAFLLSISSKIFLEIFEALTERLNYVFHALANSFPSTKKVILFDFAFQFSEQHLEFNQILFEEGDSPAYVYIMKAGEIDYRKKLSIFGIPSVKRLSMINQGDIFGQEDIFGPGRSYSVHSCVNNSVVYRIKKEALFLFQFMASLKSSVKSKAESLAKKLIELQSRNSLPPEEQLINAVQIIQADKSSVVGNSIMMQSDPANPQKSSIVSNNQNNLQSSQILTGSIMSSSMVAGRNSSQVKSNSNGNKQQSSVQFKEGVNSLTKIPSMSHLPSQTASYFFQTKNTNLGESDYDLAFQNVITNQQHRSTASTGGDKQINDKNDKSKQNDNGNNNNLQKQGKQQQQQAGNMNNLTVLPSRAQPESVYSRIVRPDSAFKEEIEQMKKEQAEQLLQFNSSQTNIDNNNNNSTALHSHSILRNKGQKSSISNTKYQEFKLSRLPKDKFALSLSIISDAKLNKKDNYKLSDQSSQQQSSLNPSISSTNLLSSGNQNYANPNRNNQSIGGGSTTYAQSTDNQDKNTDSKMIQLPIRTTSSLKKYKDYAKEYFDKDSAPKQLDFFTEFQNYKQDIQAKLLFERTNRKEVKDDPFSHINFNVIEQSNTNIGSQSNLESAPVILVQKSSSSKRDSQKHSSFSSLSQKQLQNYTKNVRINPEENVNPGRQKQSNSQKIRSSEGLNFQIPTESDEGAEEETLSPGFKQINDQRKSSLFKGNNNSSNSQLNSNRKLRFVHPSAIQQQIQDHQRMKSYFKTGNNGSGITSSPNLSSRDVAQEQSVPFRIRDHQEDLPKVNDKSHNYQGYNQGRNLMNSKIEAEKNVLKNLESSLSFGNLRAATGFRLGHPSTAQPTSTFHMRNQLKK